MGGLGGRGPPRLSRIMARSKHLPIYKRSYDLCLYLERVVQKFSRYHKYTLGVDLRDGARRVLKLIVRANARRDKATDVFDDVRVSHERQKGGHNGATWRE